jgi:ABC-type glycerol-3-phosphate transport system permease component
MLHRRVNTWHIVAVAGLVLYLAVVTFPFYWMFLTSGRRPAQIYTGTVSLLPQDLSLANYQTAFAKTRLLQWLYYSAVTSLGSSLLSLVIGLLGAYSLVRLRFPGRDLIARAVLLAYLVPTFLLFIPMFLLMNRLDLVDNPIGLILAYQSFNVPFCTWLLMSYLRTIPMELEEAALIDGCGRLGVLGRIILPLAAPGIMTAEMFAFAVSWNEFLFAVVLMPTKPTLPVGLTSFQTADVMNWGPLMATSVVALVPVMVVMLLAQRFLVGGLTAGAVKG